jgi:hypothetical protein
MMRWVGTVVQLVPLALGAAFLFLLNIPPIGATHPGVRADSPGLFAYSIALAVGVLISLRGPLWGLAGALLAGVGIAFGLGVITGDDHIYTPGFAWGIVVVGVVSLLGWLSRLIPTLGERQVRADR